MLGTGCHLGTTRLLKKVLCATCVGRCLERLARLLAALMRHVSCSPSLPTGISWVMERDGGGR